MRYSEYEKLYQVASCFEKQPKPESSGCRSHRCSWSRRLQCSNVLQIALKAAIETLVSQYGISRDRVILNWAGETTTLIPQKGSNVMNRRVEFRVAKGETEMARPEGKEAGKGSFKGNKDAGY